MKPKKEIITDAVLLRTVAVSVAGILLCLAGLAGTTWAWFTAEIRSGPNTIQCADYSVQLTVQNRSRMAVDSDAIGAGIYDVTLTMTGTGAYCKLTVKVGDTTATYYTGLMQNEQPVYFPLTVEDGAGSVQLSAAPCWGALPENANSIPTAGLTAKESGVTETAEAPPLTEEAGDTPLPTEETTAPTEPPAETEPTEPAEETTAPTESTAETDPADPLTLYG